MRVKNGVALIADDMIRVWGSGAAAKAREYIVKADDQRFEQVALEIERRSSELGLRLEKMA